VNICWNKSARALDLLAQWHPLFQSQCPWPNGVGAQPHLNSVSTYASKWHACWILKIMNCKRCFRLQVIEFCTNQDITRIARCSVNGVGKLSTSQSNMLFVRSVIQQNILKQIGPCSPAITSCYYPMNHHFWMQDSHTCHICWWMATFVLVQFRSVPSGNHGHGHLFNPPTSSMIFPFPHLYCGSPSYCGHGNVMFDDTGGYDH